MDTTRLDVTLNKPATSGVIHCQVAAHAALRAGSAELALWRRQPPPITGQPLPTSFLKHSDDQTIAAIAAVHAALSHAGWLGKPFGDWGVIAAPNFFGRSGTAHAVQHYAKEGAWGVSPHVIPHQSLHAVSGTISQLLKIHGPNFGIGGGPNACNDAFLCAGALLAEAAIPGLWLILSGHEREWLPVENGVPPNGVNPPSCLAVAMALMPALEHDGLSLRIVANEPPAGTARFSLPALVDALSAQGTPTGGAWAMPGIGWFALAPMNSASWACAVEVPR